MRRWIWATVAAAGCSGTGGVFEIYDPDIDRVPVMTMSGDYDGRTLDVGTNLTMVDREPDRHGSVRVRVEEGPLTGQSVRVFRGAIRRVPRE